MKTRARLTALIIATCFVVASAIGIIAWAIAAANVGLNSTLSVTYNAAPHVVCTASATYQKKTDTSATPFQSGTITMNYGDTSGSRTLNASSTALVLNDTNTYVVFEFTFTNNNKMNTMGINITLTDNGICKNMTRKYYFGDLSSSTIAQKESTIKSSGIENSALSSTSVTLKQNQTTRIYMLLEITPGVIADYKSNDSNQFLFNLTSVDVAPDKVSYLSADWADRVIAAAQNAAAIKNSTDTKKELLSEAQFELEPIGSYDDILGATSEPSTDGVVDYDVHISLVNAQPTGNPYQVSVGTNDEVSTSAYVQSDYVEDVIAYYELISGVLYIKIFSPRVIYAPANSSKLFNENFELLVQRLSGESDRSRRLHLFYCNVRELDISKVTNFSNMFTSGSYSTDITYPANFPEEYK